MSWLGPVDSVEKKMTEIGPSVQKLEYCAIFIISNHTKPVSMSQLGSVNKWMGWNGVDWILLSPSRAPCGAKSPLFHFQRFWLVEFGPWLIWWEFWLYLCIPGGEWWRDGVGLAPRHFSPPPIRFWDRRKPASNWDNWTQSDWSGDRSPSVRWHLITAQATTLLLLGFIFLPTPLLLLNIFLQQNP